MLKHQHKGISLVEMTTTIIVSMDYWSKCVSFAPPSFNALAVTFQVIMVILVHQWLMSSFLALHILRNVAPT